MQDLLRFTLALGVVVFHYKHFGIQSALSLPPDDYQAPFEGWLSFIYTYGYHAVSIFFFLSGYMLASQLSKNCDQQFKARQFLIKRVARIYPAHLGSLSVMGALAVIVGSLQLPLFITYNDDPKNFAASLILLNGVGVMRDTSFNLPSWSLSVEFACYLLFAMICTYSTKYRALVFLMALFFGASITTFASDPNVDNLGTGFVFFFAGVLTVLAHKRFINRFIGSGVLAILVLLAIGALSFWTSTHVALGPQKLIWIFVSLPTFIIAITQIDSMLDQSQNRRFQWFGLVSFSIYIWHFPLQALMFYVLELTSILGATWYTAQIVFVAYIVASIALGHWSLISIEKYGSQAIRRRLRMED